MRISPIADYLPGGLLATYWDTTGSKIRCIDPEINHDWKTGSPNPKIHNDCFTARWEGKLKVDKSDLYTLYTHTDDGVKVWVDGKVLIDCSRNNVKREDKANISLAEGLHDIVMEYNENYAGALAKLSWSSSSMSKRIIPSANLYSPTQIANNVAPFDDLLVSINKRIGQLGWEDIIEQLSVTGTGYKNLDINLDNKVNTTDLGLASPELQGTLKEIDANINKKAGDAGWEDVYQDVKMERLVWKRWRLRREEYTAQVFVKDGIKRLDFNNDNKIDAGDIFDLWTKKGNPEVSLDLLKKAFNRTSRELGWEDLLRPITVKGAKNWDFTVDGQVDTEDSRMYFGAMYKNGTVIQAKGDTNIYLMMNGEKIFVQDKQILEVLSLDKNGTTIIEPKELELIPTTYMDGTILRDETGKLYLMENGCRRLIERNTLRKLGMENEYVLDVKSSNAPSLGHDIKPIPYEPNRVLKSIEDGKMYLTSLNEGVKIVDGVPYTDYLLQKIGIPDETTSNVLGLGTRDTTITIRAKGSSARGTHPLIQLRVDGQVAKEWFVTDNWAEYSVTLPLSNGKHSIDVVYANDQDIETVMNTWTEKTGKWWKGTSRTVVHTDTVHNIIADRTLWVDSIRVGEQSIQAEDVSRVSYDTGESNKFGSYFDGKDMSTAREKMEWAGALRFTTGVNNNIWMLNNELKDIPDAKRLASDAKGNVIIENNAPRLESVSLDKILYPDGTVLRSDNRLYLVSSGYGREIKDDKITLEALGINTSLIVNVSKDELPVISEEPALKIMYSNGTVLKDDAGKYYFCQAGARMQIPDKTTFEAMGLYQNNVANVTIRARADIGAQAPNMKLMVDGKMLKEWTVNHTDWQDYVVELPNNLMNGEHKIDVVFDNDHYEEYQTGRRRHRRTVCLDTNLYIDNIQIKDVKGTKTIQAEDSSVRYDRGQNNNLASYQDDQDVIAGQEGMLWSGALRFKTNIEPIMNLSREQVDKIPEAAPLPIIKYANNSLVKGTGETVYMVMAGRKMAVPDGAATYDGYGLDRNNVLTITDEELVSIPTDDGLERIEQHDTQTYKNKTFQRLLSAVVKFIPVVGQVYTAVSALTGKDLLTGDKMSSADIGLGLLGGLGSWANAASGAGKVANIAKLGKDVKAVSGLVKAGKVAGDLATFANDFRGISTTLLGVDPFTNQKASGGSRLLSGLSFMGTDMWDGFNGDKLGKLTPQQVNGLSNLYRTGAMLDRGVSAQEKESLAIGAVSPYLGNAIGATATKGVSAGAKELGRFGTDMLAGVEVIGSPITAYASNARYEKYIAGNLDLNKLNSNKIIDLMKQIEKNNNIKDKISVNANLDNIFEQSDAEKQLMKLKDELIGKLTNEKLEKEIAGLQRLQNILQKQGRNLTVEQMKLLNVYKTELELKAMTSVMVSAAREKVEPMGKPVLLAYNSFEYGKVVGNTFGNISNPEIRETRQSTTTSAGVNEKNVQNYKDGLQNAFKVATELGIDTTKIIAGDYTKKQLIAMGLGSPLATILITAVDLTILPTVFGDPVGLETLLQEQSKGSKEDAQILLSSDKNILLSTDQRFIFKENIERDTTKAIEDYIKAHPKESFLYPESKFKIDIQPLTNNHWNVTITPKNIIPWEKTK